MDDWGTYRMDLANCVDMPSTNQIRNLVHMGRENNRLRIAMTKTVLITGAGSGFGKDASIALAARGHKARSPVVSRNLGP